MKSKSGEVELYLRSLSPIYDRCKECNQLVQCSYEQGYAKNRLQVMAEFSCDCRANWRKEITPDKKFNPDELFLPKMEDIPALIKFGCSLSDVIKELSASENKVACLTGCSDFPCGAYASLKDEAKKREKKKAKAKKEADALPTNQEIADELGISKRQASKLIKEGKIDRSNPLESYKKLEEES